jgi:RHS repeat-associated protein
MSDRLGGTSRFTYHDPSGRLASVVNSRGYTVTYGYADEGRRTEDGGRRSEAVGALYDLARVDYPDGTHEEFTRDARGNLLAWRDAGGQTWSYTYTARGQLSTLTNPTSGVTTYTYNPDGTLATADDSDTGATAYQYDAHKRLTQINSPNGTHDHFIYDLADWLTQYTDRLGTVLANAYDANHNLIGTTRAAGTPLAQAEQYQYDALNRVTRTTDAAGQPTQFTYTPFGAADQIVYADAASIRFQYDPRRWINGLTDRADNLWALGRDDEGIPFSLTTPEGRRGTAGSDALGAFSGITDAFSQTMTIERDAMARIVKMTDRLNRLTTVAYNGTGDVTAISMPVIGTVLYTRNGIGLVTQLTDPRGQAWRFDYTPMGRLSRLTDSLGHAWNYTYDTLGRLLTTTYPDGAVETRTYDANDNLTGRAFSGGLTLGFTYDGLNRLTSTASAPVTIGYDKRDNITRTVMGGATFGATYDARRRVKTVTYDGLMTVTYTYDARGLLTRAEDSLTHAWVGLAYDKDGLLIQITRANGVTTDITRDANARITRIRHGDKGEMTFDFDAEGQITRIIESLPLDVAAFLQPELAQYIYDNANQIAAAGFAYDERGRRTSDLQHTYTWDAADRLLSIIQGATTIGLEYTALGEVVRRTVNGVATDYFYNYALRDHPIVAEKRGGAYVRFYVHTPDGRLLYAVDAPQTSPAARFYHFNHLGTTLFLTDGAGHVSDTYGYTPFGQMMAHEGGSDQPFTFVGELGVRQEGGSGLYQMRARTYDSRTAHFLSRDPQWPDWEDPKASNPYQYAGQNPLSFIDPSGQAYVGYVDAYGNPIASRDMDPCHVYAWADENGKLTWGQLYPDSTGHNLFLNGTQRDIRNLGELQRWGAEQKAQKAAAQKARDAAAKAQQVAAAQAQQGDFSYLDAYLGQRESAGKPGAMIIQRIPSSETPEQRRKWVVFEEKLRQDAFFNPVKDTSTSCCVDCSIASLSTSGARAALQYAFVPVLGAAVVIATWFAVRTVLRRRQRQPSEHG